MARRGREDALATAESLETHPSARPATPDGGADAACRAQCNNRDASPSSSSSSPARAACRAAAAAAAEAGASGSTLASHSGYLPPAVERRLLDELPGYMEHIARSCDVARLYSPVWHVCAFDLLELLRPLAARLGLPVPDPGPAPS